MSSLGPVHSPPREGGGKGARSGAAEPKGRAHPYRHLSATLRLAVAWGHAEGGGACTSCQI
jgi:hypothetical protein